MARVEVDIDVVRTERMTIDVAEFRGLDRDGIVEAIFAMQPPGGAFVLSDVLDAADRVMRALR